ncbi:hypothetical protein SLEP1_g36836 [Rubroshorea leprosula]|uniref:Uncharacterized protein n=1 Tax=Rubroshorea leprosula TaxID=152421 RepID=A0AAV5KSR9_9ROSI|nr:hypothetical protein SLEP1_g36836 [Rubroshorea leprosula]
MLVVGLNGEESHPYSNQKGVRRRRLMTWLVLISENGKWLRIKITQSTPPLSFPHILENNEYSPLLWSLLQ